VRPALAKSSWPARFTMPATSVGTAHDDRLRFIAGPARGELFGYVKAHSVGPTAIDAADRRRLAARCSWTSLRNAAQNAGGAVARLQERKVCRLGSDVDEAIDGSSPRRASRSRSW
jgi:hypothetical protein